MIVRCLIAAAMLAPVAAAAQATAPAASGPSFPAGAVTEAETAWGAPQQQSAPARTENAQEPGVAGHYYLSGVMETGSELLLRPDGTFEWYLSYGALDQFARGRWMREGMTVTLIAERQDKSKPLYAPLDVEPWNLEAEQELLRRRRDAEAEAAIARCPFLADVTTYLAAAPVSDPGEAVVTDALREKAASARQRADAARARAEALARSAVATPSNGATQAAGQALADWHAARGEALAGASEAGLPEPRLADPTLPPQCVARQVPDAADLPREQWSRGIGVRVFDPEHQQGAKNVQVTLRFADGREERLVTASRGLAILPGKVTSPVVVARLAAPYAPGRDASFPVAPITSGILHFSIDGRQLIEPPFQTMRLRIDGTALVPNGLDRGRYERGD